MRFNKYTKEQFIEAVSSSRSIAQALKKLNIAPHGGNYRVANNYIEKLQLDISHMKGKGWNKGQTFGPKRPIEDYLSNKHYIQSNRLRKRLIREGFFERKCCGCNLYAWLDKPIPLELDHINGNHKDNSLSNLRILCPNCHAQTDTYRGKNHKNKKLVRVKKLKNKTTIRIKGTGSCLNCNSPISERAKRCKSCATLGNNRNNFKIKWPPIQELKNMVGQYGYLQTGKKLGVSDNAVRKHIKNYL